jgi:hypothetical protein
MISIVTVNWNAGNLLRECLESVIANNKGEVSQIIVVDNGSTDGSADDVDGLTGVKVIRTGDNLGFAAACNIGAAAGDSPYILFLNPDTQVNSDSLSVPLAFMERSENAKVGICGIQLIDEHDEVSRTCARFPTLGRLIISALGLDKLPGLRSAGMRMNDWNHENTCRVDQVMGAFFLIRRSLFTSCEGFDERFFVYFEEVDLSLRVKLAGYDSWYLTEARAFHAGGGTSRQVKAHRLFFSLRSRLLYGFKHFPRWQAWLLVAVTMFIEPFTRSVWSLLRRDVAGVKHTWEAYCMLWRNMGHILRGEGRYNP